MYLLNIVMVGAKGVKPGVSAYLTHTYCSKCEQYRIGRPFRCPECNTICRSGTRYVRGGSLAKNLRWVQ